MLALPPIMRAATGEIPENDLLPPLPPPLLLLPFRSPAPLPPELLPPVLPPLLGVLKLLPLTLTLTLLVDKTLAGVWSPRWKDLLPLPSYCPWW